MPNEPSRRGRYAAGPDGPIAPDSPLHRLLRRIAREIAADLGGRTPGSAATPLPPADRPPRDPT